MRIKLTKPTSFLGLTVCLSRWKANKASHNKFNSSDFQSSSFTKLFVVITRKNANLSIKFPESVTKTKWFDYSVNRLNGLSVGLGFCNSGSFGNWGVEMEMSEVQFRVYVTCFSFSLMKLLTVFEFSRLTSTLKPSTALIFVLGFQFLKEKTVVSFHYQWTSVSFTRSLVNPMEEVNNNIFFIFKISSLNI